MLPREVLIASIVQKAAEVGFTPALDDVAVIAMHADWSPVDQPFQEGNFINPLASSLVDQQIVKFTVPQNMLGILDAAGNGVPNVAYWDSLRWRIRVNGIPIPGFDSIRGPIGTPQILAPVGFPIFGTQVIEWVVSNLGTTSLNNVWAGLRGRYFSAKIAEVAAMDRAARPGAVSMQSRLDALSPGAIVIARPMGR